MKSGHLPLDTLTDTNTKMKNNTDKPNIPLMVEAMKLSPTTITELIAAFKLYEVEETNKMHDFAHATESGVSGSDIQHAIEDAFKAFFKDVRQQMATVLDANRLVGTVEFTVEEFDRLLKQQ